MTSGISLRKQFRGHFLSGLLVVIPLIVSIWAIIQVLEWLYRTLEPFYLVPEEVVEALTLVLPGWMVAPAKSAILAGEFLAAVALLVMAIALIGMVTRIGLFRWFFGMGERIVARIPFMSTVYSAVKQFMQAIFAGKSSFSRTVMIEYPRKGVYCIGFVVREADKAFTDKTGQKMVSVFMPTTPNITTGFLFLVSEDELTDVDLTVEQAFKIIVSAGMVLAHEEPDVTRLAGTKID